MCCVCQQQLGLHHSILSKHWLNHIPITQWSLDHKAVTQLLNHQSVTDSIPHRPVINVRGSPQTAFQWILDPCLLHPGLLADTDIYLSGKKHSLIIIMMILMQMLFELNLVTYLLCVDRFDQFRLPQAILVNLEEGGTFAWVLPRLNVIF